MRKYFNQILSGAAAIALAALASTAQAGNYAWTPTVPITTADAALGLPGNVVKAAVFAGSDVTVTLTSGTNILFKADGSVASTTGAGTFSTAYSGNTGNANFNSALARASYDGGPKTSTLKGLTVGQLYSVQLFAIDDRSGSSVRLSSYRDPADLADISPAFTMGAIVYNVAYFVATNTQMLIRQDLYNGNNGNANAVVIRTNSGVQIAIGTQPASEILYTNCTARFSVSAAGIGMGYQWQAGATGSGIFTNLSASGTISNTTSVTMTISNLVFGNAGDYRVVLTNATGTVTSSVATLTVITPTPNSFESTLVGLQPLSYWRLNETNNITGGTTVAYDYFSGLNGLYGSSVTDSNAGPGVADGFNTFGTNNLGAGLVNNQTVLPNSVATVVSLPPLNLPTNNVTITAWIKPNGNQGTFWGLLLNRNGGGAGLSFGGNTSGGMAEIGYLWNGGSSSTYNFHSALYPPANQWSFVAVVITPTNAVIYLMNTNGSASKTNTLAHQVEAFASTAGELGGDTALGTPRNFNGTLDEVAVFNQSLSGAQLQALYLSAIAVSVPPSIGVNGQPQSATLYPGQTASLSVSAAGTAPLAYQWQAGTTGSGVFTNLSAGGNIFGGTTNAALTITNVTLANGLDYQVIVTNSAGSITSSVATVTILTGTPTYYWSAVTNGTWSVYPITTADTTLGLAGTVVGAEVFGSTEKIVSLTNGTTIDFKTDGSVATVVNTVGSQGQGSGAFSGSTGNANFDAVLTQFDFDGGPKAIYLNNLTVGQQYSVQLFALDNRSGLGSRTANFQDPFDSADISPTFSMGDNVYTVGTFTANSSTMVIQENLLSGNNGNINALVLRTVGTTPVPPSVSTQPQSSTHYAGQSASLFVGAIGTAPLHYQWQAGTIGSGVFTNLTSMTNLTLTFTNLTLANSLDYQVIVTNSVGTVTSSVATLTVLNTQTYYWSAVTNGAWSVYPITTADATLNQTGTIVGAEVFGHTPKIVILTNGTSINFKNDGSVATVTDGTTPFGGQGQASGAWSGSTGNANFDAVLNQFDYDGGPKSIFLNNLTVGQLYSVQLFALDNRSGSNARHANFQDPADNADVSPTFAMSDNVYTIGYFTAGSSTAVIQENLPNGNGGNINALVVRAIGTILLAPSISQQPASESLYTGLTAQFSVGASGAPAPTYQWQVGSTPSGPFVNLSGGNVSGTTTPSVTLTSITPGNAAYYQVIVSNYLGSVTSSVVQLAVVTSATNSYESVVVAQNPQAYWRLNETNDPSAGSVIAYDYYGGFNGTYGTSVQNGFNGVLGPLAADGFANFGTNNTAASFVVGDPNSVISLPPLNFNTNTVTLTAWIKPNGPQPAFTGILFNRNPNGLDDDGIGFGGNVDGTGMAELGYNWNQNDPNTYNFHSGLFPPANQWSFVALVITANDATLYLANNGGISSATNNYPNTSSTQSSTWNGGTTYIGGNPIVSDGSRNFSGVIDEVGTFKYSMSSQQITGLYQAAVAPPAFTLSIVPVGGGQLQVQWPQGTLLEATNLTGPWITNSTASPFTFTPTAAQKFYRVKVQ